MLEVYIRCTITNKSSAQIYRQIIIKQKGTEYHIGIGLKLQMGEVTQNQVDFVDCTSVIRRESGTIFGRGMINNFISLLHLVVLLIRKFMRLQFNKFQFYSISSGSGSNYSMTPSCILVFVPVSI